MKILDVQQGSPEWINARLGLPTASNFDKIITAGGKPSKSADRYLARLAAEWFIGEPIEDFQSGFMERGSEMEAQAVAFYEFDTDQATAKVGLCLTNDEIAGASPDRLVGHDGLLEIKCPSAEVHMSYVLGGMPTDYFVQVQGQLWVTGRKWCDLLAFNPVLPKVKVRYERDEKFIEALRMEVVRFTNLLTDAKERLQPEKSERERAFAAAAFDDDQPF